MIETALNKVRTQLQNNSIPYEYMRWTAPVDDRYWIGEYSEVSTETEDGSKEYALTLTGTTRESWYELEKDRAKIENLFPSVGGSRFPNTKGAIIIFYQNSFPVPTGEADLKRIQVNLQIKAWKGMK